MCQIIYFLKEIVLLNQSMKTVIGICLLLIPFLQKLKSKFYRFGWMMFLRVKEI